MDARRDENRGAVEATIPVGVVRDLEKFLKHNQHGPDALNALRLRVASHWLDPTVDRLSSRMLRAYDKFCEIVSAENGRRGFHVLDAGCMCGYLKHHMELKLGRVFRYVGVDMWEEALTVAKEWQPDIEVHLKDILKDELPRPEWSERWDYVWLSNINFADPETVIQRLAPTGRQLFIAQPPWCGDWVTPAKKFGEIDVYDCGETTLIRINGPLDIQRTQNQHR